MPEETHVEVAQPEKVLPGRSLEIRLAVLRVRDGRNEGYGEVREQALFVRLHAKPLRQEPAPRKGTQHTPVRKILGRGDEGQVPAGGHPSYKLGDELAPFIRNDPEPRKRCEGQIAGLVIIGRNDARSSLTTTGVRSPSAAIVRTRAPPGHRRVPTPQPSPPHPESRYARAREAHGAIP